MKTETKHYVYQRRGALPEDMPLQNPDRNITKNKSSDTFCGNRERED